MIDEILLASTGHGESLFTPAESDWLEKRIFKRKTKKGMEYAVPCIVRGKDIRLTPEEIVRQLYAHRLMEEYGYPASRLAFEFTVHFGRETKRADIVVLDKDDPNVPYIIVETKKPKAKDGRE
jgi:type I restriction enzyme M protein